MSTSKGAIVVLAGGQGTRFWPLSRADKPKQFLPSSCGDESFLQTTVRRIQELQVTEVAPIVVTNARYDSQVREHLPNAQIIAEPMPKNTAPCIALAAAWLLSRGVSAPMIVVPADHAVRDEEMLRQALATACTIADREDVLVTIGIHAKSPHTGYGYIKQGAPTKVSGVFTVERFFEKPNRERAIEYVESRKFWWNGGMFVWRPQVLLTAVAEYMPALHAQLQVAQKSLGTAQEQAAIAEFYAVAESQSIDFGIMEHARNVQVVTTPDMGWDDVGAWDSWSALFPKDDAGNLISGDTVAIDSKNCVIVGHKKCIATVGLDGVIVVDTPDALLVCAASSVQDVKKVVEQLKKQGRQELL